MSIALQNPDGARATRLSVLVSDSEAAEISRCAAEAGLSVSAFLRAQALGTGRGEAEAMMVFDRLLDELTARVDAANAGLAAVAGAHGCSRVREQGIIPNDLGDDSSPRSFGIARGAGGAAARRERLLCQGSFSMTLGISG